MKQINSKSGRTYETPIGVFPSVTTVMALKDKPALLPWAAKCVVTYLASKIEKGEELVLTEENAGKIFYAAKNHYKQIQGEACDIGTQVHDLLEGYIKSKIAKEVPAIPNWELYDVRVKEVPAIPNWELYDVRVKNGFEAFTQWESENEIEWLESETMVYSKKGFAGTLDGIAYLHGKLFLVDFKTSRAIYDDYIMQVAAYKEAYQEMSGKKIEGIGILRLDKETGNPEWISTLKEWNNKKITTAYKKFVCLLKLYQLEKREKNSKRKPVKPKKLQKQEK